MRLVSGLVWCAQGKNAALKEAGAIVPESFEGLGDTIAGVYQGLVGDGVITPRPEPTPPSMPQDLSAAKKAGKARLAAGFLTPPLLYVLAQGRTVNTRSYV